MPIQLGNRLQAHWQSGDWSRLNAVGNPIYSTEVSLYRQGYKQQAFRIGYLEGSAVPTTAEKVYQLVDYIDQQACNSSSTTIQLALERDSVMILLMWESYLRGKDVE